MSHNWNLDVFPGHCVDCGESYLNSNTKQCNVTEVSNMRGNSLTVEECEDLVKGPGKFEGCARYIPYFHDVAMDGGADDEEWDEDDDNVTYVFEINEDDVELFDELNEKKYVKFYEDDNGFVVEVD